MWESQLLGTQIKDVEDAHRWRRQSTTRTMRDIKDLTESIASVLRSAEQKVDSPSGGE